MTHEVIITFTEDHAKIPLTKSDDYLIQDWERLKPEHIAHLAWHGLKQIYNDAGANINEKTDKDWIAKTRAIAERKQAALYAGVLRLRSQHSPVERMALDECRRIVRVTLFTKYGTLKDFTAADITERAEEYLDKHPEKLEKAKADWAQTLQDAKSD